MATEISLDVGDKLVEGFGRIRSAVKLIAGE
jgi:hypothetical protein